VISRKRGSLSTHCVDRPSNRAHWSLIVDRFSSLNISVPPWSITVRQSCFLCTSHIRQKDSLCSASFVTTILQSLHVWANGLVTIRPMTLNIAFEAIVSFLSETTVCHIAAHFSREINPPGSFLVSFPFKISSVSFCQRSFIARLSVPFV